jgi:hypothetical protein
MCRLLRSPVPGVAVAIIGAVILTWALGWQDEMAVVGALPRPSTAVARRGRLE